MGHFYKYLTLNGDGSTISMSVNGSVTPQRFELESTGTSVLKLHRSLIHIEDNANFQAEGYGGLLQLTNGIEFCIEDANQNVMIDFLDGNPIQSQSDWTRIAYDLTYHAFGAGNNFVASRFSFDKAGGPIILPDGWKIVATVNDDLSLLVDHTIQIQGVIE